MATNSSALKALAVFLATTALLAVAGGHPFKVRGVFPQNSRDRLLADFPVGFVEAAFAIAVGTE